MAKRNNRTVAKGILEIDWDAGEATIATPVKDGNPKIYDFFKLLDEYNNKSVNFSIAEDIELPTIEEEE